MVKHLNISELWDSLQYVNPETTIVCIFAIPEQLAIAAITPKDRQAAADVLEQISCMVPTLFAYARVGLYCYIGIASATITQIAQWAQSQEHDYFRIGIATVGSDGLAVTSKLELGANEAARANMNTHIFVLSSNSHQVVPWNDAI